MSKKKIAILGGARIPFQPSGTLYNNYSAYELIKKTLNGIIDKTKLEPENVDEVLIGNVIQEVKTSNIAREASIGAGIPVSVPATTVSQACISSAQCVNIGFNKIKNNEYDLAIAGGVETFSDVPIRYPKKMRQWLINAPKEFKKGGINSFKYLTKLRPEFFIPEPPLLTNYTTGELMGSTSEKIAERFNISRDEQDKFTIRSHNLANIAHLKNYYKNEIIPVNNNSMEYNIKSNQNLDKLSKLKSSFKKNGTHTAANSTGLTDGAAACILSSLEKSKQIEIKPMGFIEDSVFIGTNPYKEMLLGPAYAINKILKKNNLTINDIDIFEIHEAFAGQILANLSALNNDKFCKKNLNSDKLGEIPLDKLNLWGGSLAIGHPLAASNIRNIMTALNRLDKEDKEIALVAACADSGLANAMLIIK